MSLTETTGIIQTLAALYVVFRCIVALNTMNGKTRWTIRYAYIALGVAAFVATFTSFHKPDPLTAIVLIGVALYLLGSKRKPRHAT